MKTLLQIDNLDDRREVYRLLEHIRPPWRWQWLKWVAQLAEQAAAAAGTRVKTELTFDATDDELAAQAVRGCPEADRRVTNHAYRLAFMIVTQYGIDWSIPERGLALLARGRITPVELHTVS